MSTHTIITSPSRRCLFATLLPLLFLFQGCQSGARLSITDKNTALDEVQQNLGGPRGDIVPSHDLPPPVTQRATLPLPIQPLPNASDNAPTSSHRQARLPTEAFGVNAWKKYFGVDVGDEPSLPRDIEFILNVKAPFSLENESSPQYVRDNHLLVLIPAKVNDKPSALDKLGKLAKRYFPDNEEGYQCYSSDVRTQLGSQSPDASYWVLMTRNILKGTRNKTYAAQQKVVTKYARGGYELPSGLEAATSILAHYVRSEGQKERLFGDNPLTYTRCAPTQPVDGKYPLVVGGFEPVGFRVDDLYYNHVHVSYGVSGCRKF